MDVRCENCGTEYELDESKLKTGGVTVKCASCGHMFKIRKRAPTPLAGPPLARDLPHDDGAPAPRPRPETARGVPAARPATARPGSQSGPIGSGANKKKRTWLVRTADGEVKTCSELATLQQWIVAGTITRNCEISRNGKTWKPLGDISELSMFFDVADEARRSRDSVPTPVRARPATQPPPSPNNRATGTPAPPRRDPIASSPARSSPQSEPVTAALHAKPGATTLPGGVRPPPVTAPRPAVEAPSPSAPPSAPEGDDRATATGAWAAQKQVQRLADSSGDSGPSGPIGGLARGIPTTDAAFAQGNKHIPRLESEPRLGLGRPSVSQPSGAGFGDGDFDSDDLFSPARKSRAGMWITLVSLLIIGGAAATVYLFVFRDKGKATIADAPGAGDAGAAGELPVPGPSGTAIESPPETPAVDDDAEADARAVLHGDSLLALEELSTRLNAADGAVMLALRSRVEAALAQHLLDEALAASDDGESKKLRKQARARAQQALALARKAVAADPKQVDAVVAMADAVRVDGQKGAEVARWVRKARGLDKDNREAVYVEALLELREGKKLPATRALRKLAGDAGTLGDVRPAYRLALVDLEAKAYDQAREGAQKVLALQPGHAGATALLSRIDTATAVVTSDPMPTEQPAPDRGSTSSSGGGYDALLERADKKAESGDCKTARDLYQKALDANPVGVAALTGLGYCHIDAREFASAQSKFRAALGISPRYQDALLGVAEAYQQQGLKPQAIAAYQKFIEEHPGSPRSATAKRQIEKLGGGTPPPTGGGDTVPPTGGGTAPPTGDGTPPPTGDGDTSGGSGDTAPAPTPDPPVEDTSEDD